MELTRSSVGGASAARGAGVLGLVLLAALALPARPLRAAERSGEPEGETVSGDEAFFLLEEQIVTTATKKGEPIGRAPAVMSVVTAEEIRNMGVTSYLEVLQRVPGLGVSITGFGQWILSVRGIRTDGSEKVKLLLDGHALNEAYFGSGLTFFDDLPVENIERIEVIRGPGSALYGANAFVGVVNIITKKGADIDGVEASAGFGSFDTATVDLQAGKRFESGVDVSSYFHYWSSEGMRKRVKSDSQTLDDAATGSRASLAPGRTSFEREKLLFGVNAAYGGLDLKGLFGWRVRQDYIGLGLSLNRGSELEELQFFTEAGYRQPILDKDRLTSLTKVYFDLFDEDILFQQNPPGHVRTRDLDGDGIKEVFPDGRMSDITLSNLTFGVEEQVDLKPFDRNTLTLGLVYEHLRQFHVTSKANQDRITGDPLPEMVDFTDTANFNRNVTRDIFGAYAQDTWNPTESLGITLGVRYDRYSDFGATVNPRVGLVWSFAESASVKALYGRAFRAPNFRELYDRVGFTSGGNPDLDAEIIDTAELELSTKPLDFLKARVNGFYTRIGNMIAEDIRTRPRLFRNVGEVEARGLESEVAAATKQGSYAYVNYSFVDAEDGDGRALPNIANHTGNVGFNLRLFEKVDVNPNLLLVGERERAEGDARPDLKGYLRLDAAVGYRPVKNVDLVASVYNLLDSDIREPAPPDVKDDFPLPGITFFFRVRCRF